MNDVPLKDITFPHKQDEYICMWEYLPIGENIRVYYKPNEDRNGFNFYSISITGRALEDKTEDSFDAEAIFWGIAYFDGIRHLYMGSEQTDNDGYICYPNIPKELILVLQTLRILEEKYCDKSQISN